MRVGQCAVSLPSEVRYRIHHTMVFAALLILSFVPFMRTKYQQRSLQQIVAPYNDSWF
jgi:hypothetical protein